MANEGTNNNSNVSYHYSLTFKNTITAPAENLEELTLEQGTDVKLTEARSYLLTLQNVKVIKKIYQPIEIEADVDFMQQTTALSGSTEKKAPSFNAVSALLLQRQVELKIISGDDKFTVAKNCYVYELKPQLKVDVSSTKMNVKLKIFSMDKRMTLNKYSKAYVARKLAAGILRPESLEFGLKADGKSPIVDTDTTNLIHLIYPDKSDVSKSLERIQPYLVQYNESFYDFLVRTSNRCGEFLYFEDGKLTLGLPMTKAKTDPVTIKNFKSLVIQEVADDPMVIGDYVRDSMKDSTEVGELNHTVIEKLDNGFPIDAFPEELSQNAEVSNDEYNFPLSKDKFSSLKREALYDKPINKVMNSLKAITMGEELVGSVIGFGVQEGLLAMGGNSQAGNTNKAMQKNNIDPYTKKTEQAKDGKVVQFTSLDEEGWIDNKFYHDTRQYETELGREIICIDMGTNFVPVKLGQKVKVNDLGNYIIIEIQMTSEKYANGSEGKRQQTIYAIPTLGEGNNETYYPPVLPVPVIRKSGPQTAFVTDNNDPKYQGRVRVAFPWQSLKKGLKNQLNERSQSLKQTKRQKLQLTGGMRKMKLKLWNAIERLYDLINYVKASATERVNLLAAKKAEIEALEKEIEKLKQDKKTLEDTKVTTSTDSSQSNIKSDAQKLSIQEIESKIKDKEEKLASRKEELEEMEAAAKEYDEDEKKNTPGYVVEEDNTVVKAKWDKCEKLYYDEYEASNENLKKLEKEEKTQESLKDEIQKVLEKNLLECSTPWIRVAQPMATPGGGTYFKPQVGDEVLINFDNDNVERPYVVGSLYSKNNLDPFESFERKGAPAIQFDTGKKVSMSIMSPNGHHITFTDPKDGNKFVYGLNPGTKFWGPLLPIPSIPNSKDLAGGIHIGDRYGIYEIEMSSDNRSINIKSPLGTVDINAFTGITINAPNGDVNINGKNVNITAGNKVTITSGNNIKPPGIGEPDYRCGSPIWKELKGWWGILRFFANIGRGIRYGALFLGHQITAAAPTIVNNTLGPAAFADLSLIRHMFEVAVKPVDGTMLIKSKRYLKLEAGSGTAKIKADRFNGDKKIDSQEKFYERLIAVMKIFNDRITAFYKEYKPLWNAAMLAKMDYTEVAEAFLKEPDVDDIAKKIWGYDKNAVFIADDFKSKLDSKEERFKEGDILFKGTTFKTTEEKAEFVLLKATIYAEAAFRYHAHAITFRHLLKDFKNDDVFEDAAKDAFMMFAEPAQGKWEELYGDDSPTGDFADWAEEVFVKKDAETLLKRKTVALYLIVVSESDVNKEGKFLSLGFNDSDITDKKLQTDYNWKNFMTHFDHAGTHGNKALIYLLDGLWEPIKKNFKNPVGVIKENEIWAAGKGGQILFSDNDGATLHIEGEGLKSESQSNLGNRDQLMKLLLSIK